MGFSLPSFKKSSSDSRELSKYRKRGDANFQLEQQTFRDKLATQDVHDSQNLESSDMGKVRSKTPIEIGVAIVGVVLTILVYMGLGALSWGVYKIMNPESNYDLTIASQARPYWGEQVGSDGESCFYQIQENGEPVDNAECYAGPQGVPHPDWHQPILNEAQYNALIAAGLTEEEAQESIVDHSGNSLSAFMFGFNHFNILYLGLAALVGLSAAYALRVGLLRQLDAQNLLTDNSDINQHHLDGRLALFKEVITKYGIFPDVGAHSPVMPSSLIGHAMLSNKGVNKIQVPVRHKEDILDDDGDVITYKGEIVYDDDDEVVYETVPFLDKEFGDDLFKGSGVPDEKELRVFYNPTELSYNPGGANRDKYGSQATIAEHINEMWEFPDYEPQRPAGIYVVDEAPVNTMVLAITRAGKGQTYIEPMIDMWSRETRPNNMVINDPKGELLVKNFVRFSVRGYQVIQFNLINPMNTDIYNPLGLASEEARAGNFQKCAEYVENIADVFFPLDSGDDPMWPAAANNAFKRTVYGLIDFYLEQERELRKRAEREKWDVKVLDNHLDEMWGKVTLYNAYQFFVQLSSKKLKNPEIEFNNDVQAGKYTEENGGEEAMKADHEAAKAKAVLWDNQPEIDMLTLFFNATDALPRNGMRDLVGNADKSLRAMGGAEKMIASVYGIAITAMSFFTDPTISSLTSGTPNQNTDLAGLSFPRRIGVRFHHDYIKNYSMIGKRVVWDAFEDDSFEKKLGPKFHHDDLVGRDGWARYMFEGIFDNDVSYLRLQIINPESDTLIKQFFFKFTKSYQTNLTGRSFVKDPISGEKIVRNGVLVELVRKKSKKTNKTHYVPGSTKFKSRHLNILDLKPEDMHGTTGSNIKPVDGKANIFISSNVRYSEQTKAVFLVTPPHLMKYAKLILILLVQLVRLNFSQSYMTKSSQKPLYKTRYMLDELGNLQSEGNGISDFQTMLSIGLGQEQQFTLILQTLQQLRDVYGDSVDKIVQGNSQPLHSKILTTRGWSTMGEMAPGVKVVTPSGRDAVVTGVHPRGTRKVYRVTRADGSSALACDEHLWTVKIKPQK